MTSAQDLLLSPKPAIVPDLLSFMTDSLPLPKTLLQDTVISITKPTTWWARLNRSSAVNEDLCNVAVKLLKMPPNSAAIERVFSNFGLIQTKSVGHLTRKSGVLGSISGLATYFRFYFRFFKKGSCQLLAKVYARSTG